MLLMVMALMTVMLAMSVAPAFAARFPILGPGPVNSCKASIASERRSVLALTIWGNKG